MDTEARKNFALYLALAACGVVVLLIDGTLGRSDFGLLIGVVLIGAGVIGAGVTWVRAGNG